MSTINVIVETPKGSAQKYDFDQKTGYFQLNKMMPVGLVFPFDFGFIEGTIGEDGDPLDVIVISEIKTFPGCAMNCRIIGAIKAEQEERDGEIFRNDRFIGIPTVSVQFKDVKELRDIPSAILAQLEVFFETYNRQAGKKFKVMARVAADAANKMVTHATIKDDMATKLIQLFLPLNQKNGKAFPKSYFEEVKQSLTKKFLGLSVYTNEPADGYWENDSNKIVEDRVIIYEVMANEIDLDFWKHYRATLEKQFKQDVIVVRCLHMNLI
jgi:inorganic pyrophosphatase